MVRTRLSATFGLLSLCFAANAAVVIRIDDRLDTLVFTDTGFDPTSRSAQATGEQLDMHGEYLSQLNLANGVSITVNFHFLEPANCALFEPNCVPGSISDTLNLVFTGHTPTPTDANNMSVDLHFRSDLETPLPGLVNAIVLTETGDFQQLQSLIIGAGGPSDFQIAIASDAVPEPGTTLLLATGLLLIGLASIRR